MYIFLWGVGGWVGGWVARPSAFLFVALARVPCLILSYSVLFCVVCVVYVVYVVALSFVVALPVLC